MDNWLGGILMGYCLGVPLGIWFAKYMAWATK